MWFQTISLVKKQMFVTMDLFPNYQLFLKYMKPLKAIKAITLNVSTVRNQHGFRQNKSILTNLVLYQSKILWAFNDRQQVDSIYTDFQKAFLKVNHQLLSSKLENFCSNVSFLNWNKSYLINRSQVMKLLSVVSTDIKVHSRVSQFSRISFRSIIIYFIY